MGIIYKGVLTIIVCVTAPIAAIVAFLVWISSGFPVIFSQQRVGKNGKIFTIYKFRTMVVGAEKMKRTLRLPNESSGPTFKIKNDPRFTVVGRFLSHTGLDELPQLVNVMRGDMAFIGPRPLPLAEEKKLKPWMKQRETILPGIISPAILTGRYHENFMAWMKSDVSYAKTKNWTTDLPLIIRSILFLFRLVFRELWGLANRPQKAV
jgi:lipopolysaccharide/colanic/teichoic acid biosynthesis glycosyltransferase